MKNQSHISATPILTTLMLLGYMLLPLLTPGQDIDSSIRERDVKEFNRLINIVQEKLPPDADKLLDTAYMLAKKHGKESWIASVLSIRASVRLFNGDNENCALLADSALKIATRIKDGDLVCSAHVLKAAMYQYSSEYAKAASEYFKALDAVQEYKVERSASLVTLYNNIGTLMSQLNQRKEAVKYLLLAKEQVLGLTPVDSLRLAQILYSIAEGYYEDDAQARQPILQEVLAIATKKNDRRFIHRATNNLADIYIRKKQYDSARKYIQISMESAITESDSVDAMLTMGMLQKDLENYAEAEQLLEKALAISLAKDYIYIRDIYKNLSEVYVARNQYQKAYEYLYKYQKRYEEEMAHPENIVADFMLSFQSSEHEKRMMLKQAEVAARENEIKKRNQFILILSTVLALLATILVLAYRNYHHKRRLLTQQMRTLEQEQEIERLKAETEGADKERTRIAYDLHDGIMVRLANVKTNLNTLSPAFSGSADNNRYTDALAQLDITGRELRNTAHNLMPEILLEDGITQAIFYFCKDLEQSTGMAIKFIQVGEPLPRLQKIAEIAIYRIVQGLVQNIVSHAEATQALVQLQFVEGFCTITVEDNGKGFADTKAHEGYGLKSIRNRIKLLNGTFDIKSAPGRGTTAYLEFDVQPFLLGE